jgi:MOSC domain-containing protein YiiM
MKIISINSGKIGLHKDPFSPRAAYKSAIDKSSISSLEDPQLCTISFKGLEEDEQADQRVHGGSDKAIYAYPLEHYSFWEELIQARSEKKNELALPLGYFGENFTISGLLEHSVWVGDLWFVGDLELRVTQLREPCFKFNAKMDDADAGKTMIQTARSGWYLKVLKAGQCKAGDAIKVVHGPRKISIKLQNDAMLNRRKST